MAWLTKIVADEQVEYRLKEQAGCAVVEAGEGETVVRDDETVVLDATESPAVDYGLRLQYGDAPTSVPQFEPQFGIPWRMLTC
ncbi:hypothetical protein [Streptomyces sp. NPDC057363]|uniref:hypothetical protein n=1 Tax=Streptomyces sp. NPDC057363 TaxID=3346107 RepID=UPI0036456F4D